VLAHSYVDQYRREHRFVPLDEQEEDDPRLTAPPAETACFVDPRLEKATDEALASLSPSDGFVLVSYYLDGQTLADIARTLKLHESTVCRRVEKLTAGLRKGIRDALQRRGMSRAQAEEALQTDVRDLHVNVGARLRESLQENRTRSFSRQRATGSAPDGK
jgi:RNA polymerase sigma-70 factor (ECF subfamily)